MLHRSISFVLGAPLLVLAACSSASGDGKASGNDTLGDASAGGAAGSASHSAGGSGAAGHATGAGGAASGSGGAVASSGGKASTGGASVSDASGDSSSADAADAAPDVTPPPVCLSADEACGGELACCEAYVCRSGRCCTPNGIWSNCQKGSDCCSGSCILNQCTCVPLGYSCTNSGQCCSGFECRSGTCICPPDIRGCSGTPNN